MIFRLLTIIVTLMVTLGVYPQLPEQIPTHWNISGEIDSYAPKATGAYLLPGILTGIVILFEIVPAIDPKKKKYDLFAPEWNLIKTGFTFFFAVLQGIVLYASLYPQTDILPVLFPVMGVLFVFIGNYLSKIRQNFFLGVKVPWTLSDEDNWNKTHRYAGRTLVAAGAVTMLGGSLLRPYPELIFAVIMTGSLLPVLYSYLLYIRKTDYLRWVYAVAGVGAALYFCLR